MLTFGILSHEKKPNKRLDTCINSILKQNIPEFKIIVIHSFKVNKINNNNIIYNQRNIPFPEKKKQIFLENIKLGNYILVLKDYHYLDDNWYKNILKHNYQQKDIMTFKILNLDNNRYMDLVCGSRKFIDFEYLENNFINTKYESSLIPYKYKNNNLILRKLDTNILSNICLLKINEKTEKKIKWFFKRRGKHPNFLDIFFCRVFFRLLDYNINFNEDSIIRMSKLLKNKRNSTIKTEVINVLDKK